MHQPDHQQAIYLRCNYSVSNEIIHRSMISQYPLSLYWIDIKSQSDL